MYPKLVALDTDGTIFTGRLDEKVWGKGPKASPKLADNIKRVDDFTLQDKSNPAIQIHLCKDIPRIVTDILEHGASLAIVSRNTSKALCDRALYYFKAKNPKTGNRESIIELVRYDEVVDQPITAHFKRIHGWSEYDYADMILFDDEPANNIVQREPGVIVENCPTRTGLTWEIYSRGIERWRRQSTSDDSSTSTVLNISHFNDVYQVSEQKISFGDKRETIDVTKFATLLNDINAKWEDKGDGRGKNGLVVFSGDLFSPSVESSVTHGKHMPAIVNGLGIDISIVGNHEFDFGYPKLKELIKETKFPWLLSNIVDTNTGNVPEPMKEFHILERAGVRIGLIGLVEKDWIPLITGWPEYFQYKDMAEVGRNLSVKLRDPAGEFKCDFIIALTHSRIPNDIKLARALFALSPAAQATKNIASEHGVDLLLGGHDHVYWISKGVTGWDGFDLNTSQTDAQDDQGDVLIVKSGTDFQDLSEVVLTLKPTPAGSVRKQVIHEIKGVRHVTRGDIPVNEALKAIVTNELRLIDASMSEPICITEVQLDVRSSEIRVHESAIGNWIADCIRQAYDEKLINQGYGKTDGVIAVTGDFRGDKVYEPGPLTLGDLITILPFPDPTVVVELDANALWDALEAGLSKLPKLEGRFPALSGLRVTFDSSREAGDRVLGVWLLDSTKVGPDGKPELVDKEKVLRTSMRKYLIMCGEYMAQGGDGYDALKGKKLVIPAENGEPKSALIRDFLSGAQFLNKKMGEKPGSRFMNMQPKTCDIIDGFENQLKLELSHLPLKLPETLPKSTAKPAPGAAKNAAVGIRWLASRALFAAALTVAHHEDVGLLDPTSDTGALDGWPPPKCECQHQIAEQPPYAPRFR